MPRDLAQLWELPMLDADTTVILRGSSLDVPGAERGDPCRCVFARTCNRADLDAIVLRTTTHLIQPATRMLLNCNKARYGVEKVAGISVGTEVRVRYRNDDRLIHQIRLWDDEGLDFVPGEFALLPPRLSPVTSGSRKGRPKTTPALSPREPQRARVTAARGAR